MPLVDASVSTLLFLLLALQPGAPLRTVGQEGRLGLDDRVSRYRPAFTSAAGHSTVRQLLSHASGLPMAHPALERREIMLQEAVDAVAATPLVSAPGEVCTYGDVSIQVAGRIAEVASGIQEPSGQAWRTMFGTRLSAPLGMTATSREGATPTRNPHLSGGAASAPRDHARFLAMLLGGATSATVTARGSRARTGRPGSPWRRAHRVSSASSPGSIGAGTWPGSSWPTGPWTRRSPST